MREKKNTERSENASNKKSEAAGGGGDEGRLEWMQSKKSVCAKVKTGSMKS